MGNTGFLKKKNCRGGVCPPVPRIGLRASPGNSMEVRCQRNLFTSAKEERHGRPPVRGGLILSRQGEGSGKGVVPERLGLLRKGSIYLTFGDRI